MIDQLLPIDLSEVVHEELRRQRRPADGMLHPSGDILGSLRHSQLRAAGAPTVGSDFVNDIVLMTGTMWHKWIGERLIALGLPHMQEVNLTPWLPEGWAGTADLLVWNPELQAFVLVDLKTIKGDGIKFVRADGPKEEHIHQVSSYYHACVKAGFPMAGTCAIWYLPKDAGLRADANAEPLLLEFEPLNAKGLHKEMEARWRATKAYLDSLPPAPAEHADFVTSALAPEQERIQQLYLDKKTGLYDVLLKPHWSTRYCPFPEDICGCSLQGQTKIGTYDQDGTYFPRKGFEDVTPIPLKG